MTEHIHVNTVAEAWEAAGRLFPTDYEKDDSSSANAGYPIYRSTAASLPNAWYNYICDLGCRLELNLCDREWNGKTVNIWIDFIEKTRKGHRILSVGA